MTTHRRTGPYTFEDFCSMVREDQKADLINGVIYLAPPETPDANELFGWLITLMNLYARRTKQGRVFGSRVAFRLADNHGPEPDIAFVRTERLHRVRRTHVEGRADLVIEMVSPDSVERDYCLKRELYEEYGIPEYWIVDDWDRKVTLLQWNQEGKYRAARPRNGELHSNVLFGFRLQPEWLWQKHRPDQMETVQQMLAEQLQP
jgi:Uma2 family endonuclease